MPIATGVAKRVRFKAESAWGTLAGVTGGQALRRVSSDIDLRKDTFSSQEIRTDYQTADMRHGTRRVGGTLNGELSPGTYQTFMAAAVRQAFQSATTTGTLTNVTAQATSPQFARAAGSFITDGFKLFDVVRWTGFAGGSAPNNNSRNFLITALTATDMTGVFLDGSSVVADASGDSVTCALVGKKTWVPSTSHTDPSFTIEHWFEDIAQSERFAGCKLNQLDIDMPPSGIATISLQFMGKDATYDTSVYFTSPTAETTTNLAVSVSGKLYVAGSAVALLTGLKLSIKGNMQESPPVVGSNTIADIAEGRVTVDGEMTVLFQDGTFRDYFDDETEVSLAAILTTSSSATADLVSIVLPRIKVGGAQKDDGEKALVQTLPFTALKYLAGATNILDTTVSIQDSQAS